jgi:ribokinase
VTPVTVGSLSVARVAVVGSVNLDLVARCERLPRPGETVGDAVFQRIPGGKGANQAVAAARLGAEVTLVACVGEDTFADEALAALQEAGVELRLKRVDAPTGVAVITVAADGENTIVVVPGANGLLAPADLELPDADAVLCQLEVPVQTVAAALAGARFACLNASPVRDDAPPAALTIVNRREHGALPARGGLVAVTDGAAGARLLENGDEVARATPPSVHVVDGTAAGDAFAACLVVSLLEGREREEALRRACAAGALAASRPGAQPSLPTAAEIDAVLAT